MGHLEAFAVIKRKTMKESNKSHLDTSEQPIFFFFFFFQFSSLWNLISFYDAIHSLVQFIPTKLRLHFIKKSA